MMDNIEESYTEITRTYLAEALGIRPDEIDSSQIQILIKQIFNGVLIERSQLLVNTINSIKTVYPDLSASDLEKQFWDLERDFLELSEVQGKLLSELISKIKRERLRRDCVKTGHLELDADLDQVQSVSDVDRVKVLEQRIKQHAEELSSLHAHMQAYILEEHPEASKTRQDSESEALSELPKLES